MNTEPLSEYMKSCLAFRVGDRVAARAHLAASLGLEKPTGIMDESLAEMCDIERPNLAVSTLLVGRMLEWKND